MVKALVFIHGWASNPGIWQKQKEYFSKDYEVALPDISGAKDIGEAAHILSNSVKGKEDFVFIGWSLGWLVALELLKSSKINPKGLVAVNSTAKYAADGYLPVGPTATHLAKMIRDCKRNPRQTFESFYKSMLSDIGRDAFSNVKIKNIDYNKLYYGLYILSGCDYRDFLKAICIPALIIAGDRDAVCPKEASVYMHKMIEGSRLKILDSGHMPFVEKENDFNLSVEDFIQGL